MRQLVGLSCARCGKPVASVLDGSFCPECGCPVHGRCCKPPEASADHRICPFCGAAPERIQHEQRLHKEDAQQTSGAGRQQRGLIVLALSVVLTLYGLARVANYSDSAAGAGPLIDAVVPLLAGFVGVIFAILGLARKQTTPKHFARLIGAFIVIVIVVGGLKLLLPGTEVSPLDRKEALDRMKVQAEELGRAYVTNDHAKIIDRTHPKLVEQAGGRDHLRKVLELNAEQMKARRSAIRSVAIGVPNDFVVQGGEAFGVIPFTLEMEVDGRRGSQESFLVSISSDGGRTWTFVDGSQAASGKLKRVLPNFPEQLELPAIAPLRMLED